MCLYAYALSQRGARKLLRDQATRKTFTPIDIGIGDWCENDPSVKCIGVFPQLVDSHKGPGRLNQDSDIGSFSEEEVRTRGYTFNLARSTRLNIDRLLDGQGEGGLERQWPDDGWPVGKLGTKAVGRVIDD